MNLFAILCFSLFNVVNFNSNRGVCLTSSVKLALQEADWGSIRAQNAKEKLSRLESCAQDSVVPGDTKTFWSWNLSVMPPQWIQVPATCRAVGDSCYIFVADDQWNVHMTQENVDTVLAHFEHHTLVNPSQGIVQLDVEHFGDLPDEIDNDRHVYIFYSALGSYNGISFDGYFSAFNQMPESIAQTYGAHSNEVEMFYMTCHPLPPAAPQRLSVLAHELQHMIHWNADENEDTWVDEGCAEFAMWLYGLPDEISSFPENPDDNLLHWDQQWSDYIQTYLFTMYIFEHYGGAPTIKKIVWDTLNSVHGIQSALWASGFTGVEFNSVFNDWTIANFLDDTLYENGKFGYFNIALPPFFRSHHSTYPVNPLNKTVQPWGTDYILFSNGQELSFFFDGADDASFSLSAVFVATETDTVIHTVLDSLNRFDSIFGGFGTQYDEILISISRTCSLGQNSYIYSADALTSVEEHFPSPEIFSISAHHAVFSSEVYLDCSFPSSGGLSLKLHDISGRVVEKKDYFITEEGPVSLTMSLKNAPCGTYFLSVTFSGSSKTLKINLM